jgi:hypothetical protein
MNRPDVKDIGVHFGHSAQRTAAVSSGAHFN